MSHFQTYRSLCAVLAVFVLPVGIVKARAPRHKTGSIWLQIRRGENRNGIEFDAQRQVWLVEHGRRTQLISLAAPGDDYRAVSLSPSDPTQRYEVLIAQDDFRPVWLINRITRTAYPLPLPHWVDEFVRWSPNHAYAILHTSYEDSDQLWVLRLADRQVQEVHRERLRPGVGECCGLDDWATRDGELAAADENTVKWIDSNRFSFRLYTYCSPYEDVKTGPCATDAADDKELRAFVVTVDAETGRVTDKPVATRRR